MPKIRFVVNYKTEPGERLYIIGNSKQFGKEKVQNAVAMNYRDNQAWQYEADIETEGRKSFRYRYILKDERTGLVRTEHKWRELKFVDIKECASIFDTWSSPETSDYTFDTQAFKMLAPSPKGKKLTSQGNIHFSIDVAMIPSDCAIAVSGSHERLGAWTVEGMQLLERTNHMRWQLKVSIESNDLIEYKYLIVNKKTKEVVQWEEGENRQLRINEGGEYTKVADEGFRRSMDGIWRGGGVAIPVFSLRTEKSMGVGEFPDVKLLVDWAKKTGLKLIQLLPINDTTAYMDWRDSYPYAGISVYALHPQYLSLASLPYRLKKPLKDKISKGQKSLNKAGNQVDYEKVMKIKMSLLKEIFKAKKEIFLKDSEYRKFHTKNKGWLEPYAIFCYLRDQNKTSDFSQWDSDQKFSKARLKHYLSSDFKDIDQIQLTFFIQYHLHLQLLDAVDYAHKNNIVLKGDIPIGIFRHSCDAWQEPHLFNFDEQAGAPPDDFSVDGQNWGFPTYRWDEMAKDDFKWWRKRLKTMAQYFDAYRIDHILGFFRIWQIPYKHTSGLLGYFSPALGFTENEILAWGLHFEAKRYCRPYLSDRSIERAFSHVNAENYDQYFDADTEGAKIFKSEYSDLRKIEILKERGELSVEAYNALKKLMCSVLFIEETVDDTTLYHPRQLIYMSDSFSDLNTEEQRKLMALYNDYFYSRHESFWKVKGLEKLPHLQQATDMLVCAEDLGMVPACVPEVMKEMNMLGLQVQRMSNNANEEFSNPANAPYLSVVTASSHDTSTIREWWGEDRERTQRYFNSLLAHEGIAPEECTVDVLTQIVKAHFDSPAMWCIQPIQEYVNLDENLRWPDPQEERINIPANIPHYWRWRMHVSIEELIKNEDLISTLRSMIAESGRATD